MKIYVIVANGDEENGEGPEILKVLTDKKEALKIIENFEKKKKIYLNAVWPLMEIRRKGHTPPWSLHPNPYYHYDPKTLKK